MDVSDIEVISTIILICILYLIFVRISTHVKQYFSQILRDFKTTRLNRFSKLDFEPISSLISSLTDDKLWISPSFYTHLKNH
jgi:hypothetical protein